MTEQGKIFISYRRGDDSGFCGRLYDRLEGHFKKENLFMDVDSIEPGDDFVILVEEWIHQSDIFLAVIGQGWLDAVDKKNNKRLYNKNDFVRVEIETAIKNKVHIIPVLVNNAVMPDPNDLPESLESLTRRNAMSLTHERFNNDVSGLIKVLENALVNKTKSRELNITESIKAKQEYKEERVNIAKDVLGALQMQKKRKMKRYEYCNYSFFYSFSSADNDMRLDWISDCYDLLKKITRGYVSTVDDFKEPFYYVDEKILYGRLDAKIKRKLSESYAYIAVIDENYLKSNICDIEFDYIRDCFNYGEKDVLAFILVLSEEAGEILNEKYELSNYTVHHVYKSNGNVIPTNDQELLELLKAIGKRISHQIENENTREIKLAIGPCTDDIAEQVDDLVLKLKQKYGRQLYFNHLTEKDFSNISYPQNFGNYLNDFDLIIQPFSMAPPVYGLFQTGGLIASIRQSLDTVDRLDKLICWFIETDLGAADLDHGHIDFLKELKKSALQQPEIFQMLDTMAKRA